MWTLGIDTSYLVTTGLAYNSQPVDAEVVSDNRAHAEQLMPSIQRLLQRNDIGFSDISDIAVGLGPGPFTGLRIGIVTAWTLAYAAAIKPHGVCSLDVIAASWVRDGSAPMEFIVTSDARRKELYWARYRNSGERVGQPQVSSPKLIPQLPVCGPGVKIYPELFDITTGPKHLDCAVLAADWHNLENAGHEPLYLRPADASVPTKHKSALPKIVLERK